MSKIPTFSELQKLSDEKLIERYDQAAERTVVGTEFYLRELSRRDTRRQSETLLKFTQQIRTLTIVVALLTLVNVFFVGYSVLR
ncbi:MAG: hypothetical protein KatS3mg012_1090 [Gaiellaceae bacterium]|jgi:hypothetical protein|nr:MAG: hypothetical protein KatS3mg012_1090 [Gaiellaceae bacterium]